MRHLKACAGAGEIRNAYARPHLVIAIGFELLHRSSLAAEWSLPLGSGHLTPLIRPHCLRIMVILPSLSLNRPRILRIAVVPLSTPPKRGTSFPFAPASPPFPLYSRSSLYSPLPSHRPPFRCSLLYSPSSATVFPLPSLLSAPAALSSSLLPHYRPPLRCSLLCSTLLCRRPPLSALCSSPLCSRSTLPSLPSLLSRHPPSAATPCCSPLCCSLTPFSSPAPSLPLFLLLCSLLCSSSPRLCYALLIDVPSL